MYLTQEQCNALPAGARVRVTWAGGNGPHVYTVTRRDWTQQALVEAGPHDHNHLNLDFVGRERFHTRVEVVAVPVQHDKDGRPVLNGLGEPLFVMLEGN